MKFSHFSIRRAFFCPFILTGILLLFFFGCATKEPVNEPAPVPEKPVPEKTGPEPFIVDWAGTTWIFRDAPKGSREFPGYRGIHLGRDGKLFLINMDKARGKSWSAKGNKLTLELMEGVPSLPLKGTLLAFVPEEEADSADGRASRRVWLVPEAAGVSALEKAGIVLEEARANVDIVENHWIPRTLENGETVHWPMSKEIYFMLLPDGVGGLGLMGHGGENRFRGELQLGNEILLPGPIAMTKKTGPNTPFENLYVRKIAETTRYVQVDDDLFFYADTRPVVGFRVRLFD